MFSDNHLFDFLNNGILLHVLKSWNLLIIITNISKYSKAICEMQYIHSLNLINLILLCLSITMREKLCTNSLKYCSVWFTMLLSCQRLATSKVVFLFPLFWTSRVLSLLNKINMHFYLLKCCIFII